MSKKLAYALIQATAFNRITSFSKIFRIGKGTFDANFDIYNSFNSDAGLSLTSTYSGVNGGTWLRPTAVIQGRIYKFGFRWDF